MPVVGVLGVERHTGKKVQDRLESFIQIEFQSLCRSEAQYWDRCCHPQLTRPPAHLHGCSGVQLTQAIARRLFVWHFVTATLPLVLGASK
jgi:hypothetical protein